MPTKLEAGAHFLRNRGPDEELRRLDHTVWKTQFNPGTSAIPFGTLGSAPVKRTVRPASTVRLRFSSLLKKPSPYRGFADSVFYRRVGGGLHAGDVFC